MGRTSRRKKVNKVQDDEESSKEDDPNPESEEFFHDDVSKFTMNREKIPLDPEGELSEDELNEDEIEEVMGLDLEDSDDDDDDDDNDDEDEDDSESNDEAKLPNDKAWGKKKSIYYNADTGDADIGSDEEAWELEQQEEEEALALQKRMGAALDEEGLDLADFEIPFEGVPEELSVEDDKEEKTIAVDLSKLSKAQKLEILFRDSPELFELLEEFKEKLDEVETRLSPLLDLAKVGRLPVEGAKYVELKKDLYLNYCINIGFYLVLKARQSSVKDHPVIERIVQYRTLIKELQPIDKKLESDIEILLANKETLLQPEDAQSSTTSKISKDTKLKKQGKKVKAKVKLSALLDENEDDEDQEHQPPKKKTKQLGGKEEASIDPLQYYEQVRLEKKKAKEMKKIAARLAQEPEFDQNFVEMDEEGKRAITYQISKNKGLTVRRKKQDRNPRVKHRKKYSKAIIKRKSQVRPVTNEDTRYGGEKSGIRAFLTRSVKIK